MTHTQTPTGESRPSPVAPHLSAPTPGSEAAPASSPFAASPRLPATFVGGVELLLPRRWGR